MHDTTDICNRLREAFGLGPKLDIDRSVMALKHIRRLRDELVPSTLAKGLCALLSTKSSEKLRATIDDMIEYLDGDWGGSLGLEDLTELVGPDEAGKTIREREELREGRKSLWELFSRPQAAAIAEWLRYLADAKHYSPWRDDQLRSAIRFWTARA
jgi:hypothetical protein